MQENERLRGEIAELNDTVFSKSFKAPSAWAEREVKYKMERSHWEKQVCCRRFNMPGISLQHFHALVNNK